ncbi:hypothetical protein ACBQ54_00365 [Providencia vermicola]
MLKHNGMTEEAKLVFSAVTDEPASYQLLKRKWAFLPINKFRCIDIT